MLITQMLVPTYKYAIKCPYEMQPDGICVHNTANKASAMAEISYMIGNNNSVSYHYAIDGYRVVQGIPENRNTWHAGDGRNGKGNRNKISVEICYSTGTDEEFEQSENLAAEFIALKLKEKGWNIDRVSKHQDYNGKYCPHRTLDLGWIRFLNKIQAYLNGLNQKIKQEEIPEGSDEEVRTYQNGSTSEVVYADTNCTIKLGSLNPREKCDCFGKFQNRAMVRYQVGNTGNYKIGFCKWLGGVK